MNKYRYKKNRHKGYDILRFNRFFNYWESIMWTDNKKDAKEIKKEFQQNNRYGNVIFNNF